MTTLADLHRAVQSALASKRLGRPVFVRYLLHSQDKPDAALPRLAHLTAAVREWVGQPLERVYAVGAPGGPATAPSSPAAATPTRRTTPPPPPPTAAAASSPSPTRPTSISAAAASTSAWRRPSTFPASRT